MKMQSNPRTKLFDHAFLPQVELNTVYEDGKRFYVTPEGNKYPSVTTVLSSLSKQGITDWENKVGKEQADIIRNKAANRGTKVHSICEDYVHNKEDYLKGHMPSNISLFKQIQPYLDEYVDKIYGIEIPLYSDYLRTAGRCDLFCRMHGVNTIADFKTSTKEKNEEWIESYFLQTTAYSMMVNERYNMHVHYICILIAVEDGTLQYFVKSPEQYKEKVEQIFRNS
jgi:hypothetical protein